jgi:hypothetical protein
LGIGSPITVIDWASFCQEVVLVAFVDNPEQLGVEKKQKSKENLKVHV